MSLKLAKLFLVVLTAVCSVRAQAPTGTYERLGEKDQALFWLEKAVEQRSVEMTLHCRNPFWDGFRSDPRFADLVRRMGLEP